MGRRRNPRSTLSLRPVALAAAIGVAGLFGCAECPHDDVFPATAYAPIPAGSGPTRSPTRAAPPERARYAATFREPEATAPARALAPKPQSKARFVLLENTEAVGRSRSYTGDQSDPHTCAERCLATKGCDAFSFERETKLCFLVSQVTELTPTVSFVSGRLR
jgi:hypothetical protein